MPIYEYRCSDCGQRFVRLQRMGAGSEGVICPHCSTTAVERLPSVFSSSGSTASSPATSSGACGPST
jgi:putative FmdB family regulatory protein